MRIQVLKNETYAESSDLPKKSTDRSTGYDIISVSDPEIVGCKHPSEGYYQIDYIQYKTNLKLAVQKEQKSWIGKGIELIDYDILAFPRSSISKYNLILSNCIGLIDADYRGEILLRFKYIWQPEDLDFTGESVIVGKPNFEKLYKKGDKMCQLKVTRVENVEFVLVNELDSTTRGDGGFGSTDNKKSEIASNQMSVMEELYSKSGGISTPTKKYIDLIKEREQKYTI